MEIVKKDSFRSQGASVNQADDMCRGVIDVKRGKELHKLESFVAKQNAETTEQSTNPGHSEAKRSDDERKFHKLKIWQPFFVEIISGLKRFEIRKDDRDFQVGDTLSLFEWSPDTQRYTGLFANFRITYKLAGGQFGLEEGYCCLGIVPSLQY